MAPRASSLDPYRTYKFRVRLDGAIVAGLTRVSALGRTVQGNEVKEAGDLFGARWMPGALSFDEVQLEQGWSADNTFESWANEVLKLLSDPASARSFKRTVFIDVFNLQGTPATLSGGSATTSYKLHRAWVSKYVALPELDATQGGIGIRSVSLRHEGWERV
jgi:phage tail-like protein